jgi:hypothetical protein
MPDKSHTVYTYEYPKKEKIEKIDISVLPVSIVKQKDWKKTPDKKFIANIGMLNIISKIKNQTKLKFKDIMEIKRGVLFDNSLLTDKKKNNNSYRYFTGDVYRYKINKESNCWVEYGSKMREYPKDFKWFEGVRILLRRLVNRQQRLMACLLSETIITNKNLYSIKVIEKQSIYYILGLLNSKLISKIYLSQVSQATKDDFPQVTIRDILDMPVPSLDFSNKSDMRRHDRMVELVKTMLELNKRVAEMKAGHEKTVVERQIAATDQQNDQLVYELYGLTDEEIAVVEENK